MHGITKRFCDQDFDDEYTRGRFKNELVRLAKKFAKGTSKNPVVDTPYWRSNYNEWMLYECTISPCGVRCTKKGKSSVEFKADCAGVSDEGICMSVTFNIPIDEFSEAEMSEIDIDSEYYPCKSTVVHMLDGSKRKGFTYGPFDREEYISKVEWWYDRDYDDYL